MNDFLAIDFGTSNCCAAIINKKKEIEFVPLDGDSYFLPSAIFVQVNELNRGKIETNQLLDLANKLYKDEENRYKQDLEILKNRYRNFYNTYVPMAKDPNKPYKKNTLRKYVDSKDLKAAIENFKATRLADEKKRLIAEIKPVKSLSKIIHELKIKFELNSIQSDIDLLNDESFFTAILNPDSRIYFGNEALSKYTENPLSGFFLRSPKAFLGTSLNHRSKELFIKIISLIIEYIKIKSEIYFGIEFSKVVFGRPVNYLGSNSSTANNQALSIMNSAALRMGFTDIRYVIEPFAAALVSRRTMFATSSPSIIIDIGGGTSDVAIISNDIENEDYLTILASSGSRVGGDDFDQSIAIKFFVEILKQNIPEFHSIIIDALSTRDLHAQSKFAKIGRNILEKLDRIKFPVDKSYLFDLYRAQLQHKVILFSESIKLTLGSKSNINNDFVLLHSKINLNYENCMLTEICPIQFKEIEYIIKKALEDSCLDKIEARKVFVTGGMSNSDALIQYLKDLFPVGSVFYRLSPLNTIISGLAVAANYLSLHEINRPITSMYGIPIERFSG
jgi:hypothetical chaperone protein